MQKFRPVPSFQQFDVVDMTEGQLTEDNAVLNPVLQPVTTSPLILFPPVTTEQLSAISLSSPDTTGALSLAAALQATMCPGASKDIVVVPATLKRKQDEESASSRRMNPRLRFGIICFAILFVSITTLLSLVPLAAAQNTIPIFSGVSKWVLAEQLNWQIQAHIDTSSGTAAQNSPATIQNTPAPPPIFLPKNQYVAIAEQDAVAAGISPDYFIRQINAESGFNPNAASPAGAVGIAQFEPGTAAGLGINPWDPAQALRAAANLMASYANHYGGNYAMALAAYNAGGGTVQYAVSACGANWMNCLPGETQHYIYVIMGV